MKYKIKFVLIKLKSELIKFFASFKTSTWIVFSFFVLLNLLIINYFYLQVKTTWKTASWEKQRQEQSQAQRNSYQEFIQEQAKKAETEKQESTTYQKRQLLGNHKLHLVFTKPPWVSSSAVEPLVSKLKSHQANRYSSFLYINTFFEQEAKKYGDQNFNLEIAVDYPLVDIPNLEKVGDMMNFWGKDAFGVTKLEDNFAQTLANADIKVNENDLVIYLYFDDELDSNTDSDSFYDLKKFRSFARKSKGVAYVNIYSFSPEFAATAVEIITHELLHLFGAVDKYKEYEYGCRDVGRGDIDKDPIFPQTTSDIMCGLIEYKKDEFKAAYFDRGEIVINKYTAGEIGWIDKE